MCTCSSFSAEMWNLSFELETVQSLPDINSHFLHLSFSNLVCAHIWEFSTSIRLTWPFYNVCYGASEPGRNAFLVLFCSQGHRSDMRALTPGAKACWPLKVLVSASVSFPFPFSSICYKPSALLFHQPPSVLIFQMYQSQSLLHSF